MNRREMMGSVAGAMAIAAAGGPAMGALESGSGMQMIPRPALIPRSTWEKSGLLEYRIVRTMINACPDRECLNWDNAVVHAIEIEEVAGDPRYADVVAPAEHYDFDRQVILSAGDPSDTAFTAMIRVAREGDPLDWKRGKVDSVLVGRGELGQDYEWGLHIDVDCRDFINPEANVWKKHFAAVRRMMAA